MMRVPAGPGIRPMAALLDRGTRREGAALLITGLVGIGAAALAADPVGAIICGLVVVAGRILYARVPTPESGSGNALPEMSRARPMLASLAVLSVVAGGNAAGRSVGPAVSALVHASPLAGIEPCVKTAARNVNGRTERYAGLLAPQGT